MDKEKQKPLNVKAALKWVLQNEHVHTTIPGFTTFDQLNLDLQVMSDLSLNESENKDLQEAMSLQGLYCQGCETCLSQCKENMPVPELMRAYMYAYGYKNRTAAYDLMAGLKIPAGGCDTCTECTVVCEKSFTIRRNVRDIIRLTHVPREFIA